MANLITRRTACSRDCPDACEIVATLDAGRIVRLQGAADHPITQGFLCHRTSRFLERQYAPERLTRPLLRQGDGFREIDWSEALDLIAARMLQFRAESGAASILHYRCGGSMGIMKHVSDWFFRRFGPVTEKSGDVCSGAGEAAQTTDFGLCDSNDVFDLLNSRTIVLWGKNVFVSSVHLLPVLRQARQAGARLILVDPVHHRTAQICDQVVQPRAGGDAALACGVARWLMDQGRHDPDAADYCDHWETYQQLIGSRSFEQWAAIADVPAAALIEMAEAYAAGPSAILIGWGMQRRRFGAATIRAVDALAAISGNLGVAGGGASFYFRRRGAFDFSFRETSDEPPRRIPEPLLGPGILAATDPPLRMVWVTAANPVAMLPHSTVVAEALRSREFTVVVDSFFTDTARCADLVLPTTTFLEEDDLLGAYGHHWLAEMRAVTLPPDGVRSDYQIVQQLAARVGLNELFADDVDAWKDRLLTRVAPRGVTREALRRGAVRNPLADKIVFAERQFATASGRVNLICELPEPLLTAPDRMTLKLAALSTARAQSSQWRPAEQEGPATATVHPDAVPEARTGQLARLRSRVGELTVVLQLDPQQRPDVVLMEKGGWLHAGRCANALVPAELTDDGECAVYYDTEVSVTLL